MHDKLFPITQTEKLVVEADEQSDCYGKFVIHPLMRGYGNTLGNALRRVLLSSISGYAITAVRIQYSNKDGEIVLLTSEFENVWFLYEDVMFLIQNFKRVHLNLLDSAEKKVISLEKIGKGPLLAGDLAVDPDIEVKNPDFVIANLNHENASLFIELEICYGYGYLNAEQPVDRVHIIGAIPIDCIYSPVTKVNYSVENVASGSRVDCDRCILEIWTNGTVKPQEALSEASKILIHHFKFFISLNLASDLSQEVNKEEIDTNPLFNHKSQNITSDGLLRESENSNEESDLKKMDSKKLDFLLSGLDTLGFSSRIVNALKSLGILTVKDLVEKNKSEIGKTKNLGRKSIEKIQEKLKELGLNFS